ncbi:transporter [Polaribacter haliotis]|uniref:Transporter n=1 Tax=Polaribacter haliotis TaxID=1888915 RepID=A0A7L8AHX7_9FLAO|nr:transporter [Polaribacter haliotis]QOD61534.1 transporter [Polaribacter haliotis]
MKKVLFIAFLAIAGLGKMNAQEGVLNGGFNIGLPTGDFNNSNSFTLGAELNYMFPVAEGFTLGPSIQYSHFFGKDIDLVGGGTFDTPDTSFLPISGAARFNVSDKFVVGANIGYAVGINEGNEGGFYYRPIIGYKVGETTQLNLSYSGISNDGITASNVSLGVMFGI